MMRMQLSRWVCAACMAVFSTLASADDTFRCGNRLIEPGMTQAEVLQLCGEPSERSVEVQDVRSGNRVVGKTQVQRWTYSSYAATRVLTFDKDVLRAIE